jgi:hypothetical protein
MTDPLLLLYRADWTQWSLSADVVRRRNRHLSAQLTDRLAAQMRRRGGMTTFVGSAMSASRPAADNRAAAESEHTQRILLAPGARYRFQPDAGQPATDGADRDHDDDQEEVRLIVSDGESCWVIWDDAEADQSVADLTHPPISHIVRPTWLMHQLELTPTGTTEVAGRAALQVRGVPRPPADRWGILTAQYDQVDIVIDAELGLVLHYQAVFDGQPISSQEVADLVISPSAATDPASFRPGDGVEVVKNDIGPPESHLYWRGGDYEPDTKIDKRKMAMGLVRGGVYLAARQLARPGPAPGEPIDAGEEDAEADMPAAQPPSPGPAPATPGSRTPVSDDVLRLITHAGMAPLSLTARVHHWLDASLARRSVPMLAAGNMHEVPIASGFLGAEQDSFFHMRDSHETARLTLAMPDRYRIDFERQDRPRHPLTVACDGERLRKVYRNRVVASPPLPLPTDFVRLVEPAWLLRDWPLSEAGEETVGGRRAVRLITERPPVRADRRSPWSDHTAMIALLIDTELGIVLQQVSYLDNKPVSRFELREVQPCGGIDVAEFGRGIAPELPVYRTNGEPICDLDLPAPARAVGQVGADLLNLFRGAR